MNVLYFIELLSYPKWSQIPNQIVLRSIVPYNILILYTININFNRTWRKAIIKRIHMTIFLHQNQCKWYTDQHRLSVWYLERCLIALQKAVSHNRDCIMHILTPHPHFKQQLLVWLEKLQRLCMVNLTIILTQASKHHLLKAMNHSILLWTNLKIHRYDCMCLLYVCQSSQL